MKLEHEKAIGSLERLSKKWPKDLTLFSASGNLIVIDSNNKILAYIIGIPNDGGDPGTTMKDNGDEYLGE